MARNDIGATFSGDETFATLQASPEGLPDGRAYELVTPPNKEDAEDMFGAAGGKNFDLGYSSVDGNEFLLLTTAAFGQSTASGENSYVFKRSEGTGWSEVSVASPNLGIQSVAAEVYDPLDFSVVGVNDTLGSEVGEVVNLVGAPGGPYTNVASSTRNEEAYMVGASQDLNDVVVESTNHSMSLCEHKQESLDEGQDVGSHELFEWIGSRGCSVLVNAMTKSSLVGSVVRFWVTVRVRPLREPAMVPCRKTVRRFSSLLQTRPRWGQVVKSKCLLNMKKSLLSFTYVSTAKQPSRYRRPNTVSSLMRCTQLCMSGRPETGLRCFS